jgi:hypothetical protein
LVRHGPRRIGHGIVRRAVPSETWQIVISVVGAIMVGLTAFVRMTAIAAPEPAGRNGAII